MKDFTSGNIARQILMFSVPMLIGNLFQQVYSMVDAMVVGRYVGGNALAAIGIAMNVLMFLLAVLIGLTTGASVLISQFYGAKQLEKLERTVSTSIIFLAGLSIVITVLGVVFAPFVLRLLDAAPEVMDDAVLYTRILMAGMVFPIFFNMYTAYLRALGDSRGPLYILIFCTVLNAGLDLLFVIQFHMDVLGVAVATVIAQALSVGLCYGYTRWRVPVLRVKKLVFDRELFRSILKYGTPAAVQLSVVSFANLTITRLINSFGPAAMAGITAATKIDQFAIMPVSTVSLALSTFVGQNMGAGQEERARKGLKSAALFMAAIAACLSVLLVLIGPWLVFMFINPGDANAAEISGVGLNYLNIIVASYVLFALLFAFNGFFRGVGDAMMAMAFPVASLTIRTLAAYMLVYFAGMGPEALAWSVPVGWSLTSLGSWIYYKKRLWVGKVIAGPRETDPA